MIITTWTVITNQLTIWLAILTPSSFIWFFLHGDILVYHSRNLLNWHSYVKQMKSKWNSLCHFSYQKKYVQNFLNSAATSWLFPLPTLAYSSSNKPVQAPTCPVHELINYIHIDRIKHNWSCKSNQIITKKPSQVSKPQQIL